jgi:TolB protein
MKRQRSFSRKNAIQVLLVLMAMNIAAGIWLLRPLLQNILEKTPSAPTYTASPMTAILQTSTVIGGSPTLVKTDSITGDSPAQIGTATIPAISEQIIAPLAPIVPTDAAPQNSISREGALVLSLADSGFTHLFAYHPENLAMTRLTDGSSDDSTPAISPDGARIAYSFHDQQLWSISVLDIVSGQKNQLTTTNDYLSSPSWSPDGQWLVYDRYVDQNLELFILSVREPDNPPVRLTENNYADYSAAWSPQGRNIAFVSNRSGDEDIWIARLDDANERFINVSNSPSSLDRNPDWSPDGRYLAWSAEQQSVNTIKILDTWVADAEPIIFGPGSQPIWNSTGDIVYTNLIEANGALLAAYRFPDGVSAYPLKVVNSNPDGLAYGAGALVDLARLMGQQAEPRSDWQPLLSVFPIPPNGRDAIVPLQNITAPYPYLHDRVDESFYALRSEIIQSVGWDFLANLENVYLPITSPTPPDIVEEWALTGRAITVSSAPMSADWMKIVREDFNGQTYWRIFLRARYQNGSQGGPMVIHPWNLSARYAGDTEAYEQGGSYEPVPDGYWVDFTEIALRYGWERLPALINWRSYYIGAQFNTFVLRDGLNWKDAMAQLYPPEALAKPTYLPTSANGAVTPTPAP